MSHSDPRQDRADDDTKPLPPPPPQRAAERNDTLTSKGLPAGSSLAMLTDLYELTMAYGFWKNGMLETEAAFHLSFREAPFDGGYAVSCGLESVIEYIETFRFTSEDTDYLASLNGLDGNPLFTPDFLAFLRDLRLECDVDAPPEGTVVFAREPLIRVSGPILQCQLIESALLNLVNFQTLIATKAARVVFSAEGDQVIEFGLRRAHGVNGALTASRAAYVGGCHGTSNVLAGQVYGIPVTGTLAHSWVMAFDDELEAFDAYARALPNNTILLVDTYNSIEGVQKAIEVGRRLRERGHDLAGIRLDSGDLAWLSRRARRILDESGFHSTAIAATNDLDEFIIASLKQQHAAVSLWGVGTRLVTAFDQPALGGIYKLSAVRTPGGPWKYRVKLSEQAAKTSTPGVLQVRRFEQNGKFIGDMVYDIMSPPEGEALMLDPLDATRRKSFDMAETTSAELLVPIFRKGRRIYESPRLAEIRTFASEQLDRLDPGTRRLVNPHEYPVGFEERLHALRTQLILEGRGLRRATAEKM